MVNGFSAARDRITVSGIQGLLLTVSFSHTVCPDLYTVSLRVPFMSFLDLLSC